MKKFVYQLFLVAGRGNTHGHLDVHQGFYTSLGKIRETIDALIFDEDCIRDDFDVYRHTLNTPKYEVPVKIKL